MVARLRRNDLFFAGDEGDFVRPDAGDDAAIDLARQKAQRQPDDAGAVCQHPVDRKVRLAGVGRPEHRRDGTGALLPELERVLHA